MKANMYFKYVLSVLHKTLAPWFCREVSAVVQPERFLLFHPRARLLYYIRVLVECVCLCMRMLKDLIMNS